MSTANWPMPASTVKEDETARHVGVEMEFQGVPIEALANLIADTLNGEIRKVSKVEYLIAVPEGGEYRAEVDYALLKRLAKKQQETDKRDESSIDALAVDALTAASDVIVPCEVVAPPIAMDRFAEPMHALTVAIREAGGKGTKDTFFYAFGVHLNVEPPSMQVPTISAYMKAFVCLFDWIIWDGKVDWARRITPHIQRYPTEYELLLTDPDYWPDTTRLIDDYLAHNATRNRALDMLPLFSVLDEDRVQAAVDDDRVQARPAFHYRAANCEVDDPDWSIADPWKRWLQIEHLANDRDALNACCEQFRLHRPRVLHSVDNHWRKEVTRWLREW